MLLHSLIRKVSDQKEATYHFVLAPLYIIFFPLTAFKIVVFITNFHLFDYVVPWYGFVLCLFFLKFIEFLVFVNL